jgi:hypothetical protein
MVTLPSTAAHLAAVILNVELPRVMKAVDETRLPLDRVLTMLSALDTVTCRVLPAGRGVVLTMRGSTASAGHLLATVIDGGIAALDGSPWVVPTDAAIVYDDPGQARITW